MKTCVSLLLESKGQSLQAQHSLYGKRIIRQPSIIHSPCWLIIVCWWHLWIAETESRSRCLMGIRWNIVGGAWKYCIIIMTVQMFTFVSCFLKPSIISKESSLWFLSTLISKHWSDYQPDKSISIIILQQYRLHHTQAKFFSVLGPALNGGPPIYKDTDKQPKLEHEPQFCIWTYIWGIKGI